MAVRISLLGFLRRFVSIIALVMIAISMMEILERDILELSCNADIDEDEDVKVASDGFFTLISNAYTYVKSTASDLVHTWTGTGSGTTPHIVPWKTYFCTARNFIRVQKEALGLFQVISPEKEAWAAAGVMASLVLLDILYCLYAIVVCCFALSTYVVRLLTRVLTGIYRLVRQAVVCWLAIAMLFLNLLTECLTGSCRITRQIVVCCFAIASIVLQVFIRICHVLRQIVVCCFARSSLVFRQLTEGLTNMWQFVQQIVVCCLAKAAIVVHFLTNLMIRICHVFHQIVLYCLATASLAIQLLTEKLTRMCQFIHRIAWRNRRDNDEGDDDDDDDDDHDDEDGEDSPEIAQHIQNEYKDLSDIDYNHNQKIKESDSLVKEHFNFEIDDVETEDRGEDQAYDVKADEALPADYDWNDNNDVLAEDHTDRMYDVQENTCGDVVTQESHGSEVNGQSGTKEQSSKALVDILIRDEQSSEAVVDALSRDEQSSEADNDELSLDEPSADVDTAGEKTDECVETSIDDHAKNHVVEHNYELNIEAALICEGIDEECIAVRIDHDVIDTKSASECTNGRTAEPWMENSSDIIEAESLGCSLSDESVETPDDIRTSEDRSNGGDDKGGAVDFADDVAARGALARAAQDKVEVEEQIEDDFNPAHDPSHIVAIGSSQSLLAFARFKRTVDGKPVQVVCPLPHSDPQELHACCNSRSSDASVTIIHGPPKIFPTINHLAVTIENIHKEVDAGRMSQEEFINIMRRCHPGRHVKNFTIKSLHKAIYNYQDMQELVDRHVREHVVIRSKPGDDTGASNYVVHQTRQQARDNVTAEMSRDSLKQTFSSRVTSPAGGDVCPVEMEATDDASSYDVLKDRGKL